MINHIQKNAAEIIALQKSQRNEAERRRARLAKLDAEYAAHAPRVTVIERNGIRVETRGQPCIGSRTVWHVSY